MYVFFIHAFNLIAMLFPKYNIYNINQNLTCSSFKVQLIKNQNTEMLISLQMILQTTLKELQQPVNLKLLAKILFL